MMVHEVGTKTPILNKFLALSPDFRHISPWGDKGNDMEILIAFICARILFDIFRLLHTDPQFADDGDKGLVIDLTVPADMPVHHFRNKRSLLRRGLF